MRRKSTLIATIAIGVFVSGFIYLKFLINANPYSASYRNSFRTKTTLRLLLVSIDGYRATYGTFPAGENASILRKLCGDNADKIIFLNPPATYNASTWPPQIERDLELRVVDGWNTPIRFNFESNLRVESAGEDKKFETSDDLVESKP